MQSRCGYFLHDINSGLVIFRTEDVPFEMTKQILYNFQQMRVFTKSERSVQSDERVFEFLEHKQLIFNF